MIAGSGHYWLGYGIGVWAGIVLNILVSMIRTHLKPDDQEDRP